MTSAGACDELGAVVHADREPTAEVVLEVRRLAAFGLGDRLKVVRRAPPGLEDETPDLAAADGEDLDPPVREFADLVRRLEALVLRLVPVDTPARILDVAERLVQTRGYNGFSYAGVAAEVGVTKASLHYHFAGKAELGAALIERYAERSFQGRAGIDRAGGDARSKLDAFAGIRGGVLRECRLCLSGMLAADYETLPKPMQEPSSASSTRRRLGVCGPVGVLPAPPQYEAARHTC